jgi:hypothetical protein
LRPEAEADIHRELNRLADRVIGDVFETLSKHPPGTKIKVEKRRNEEPADRRRRRGLERTETVTQLDLTACHGPLVSGGGQAGPQGPAWPGIHAQSPDQRWVGPT